MTPPPITRRAALALPLLGVGAAAATTALSTGSARAAADPFPVYLGAYSGGDPQHGIGFAHGDDATGALQLDAVTPTTDPSFLALSPSRTVLYAVNDTWLGQVSAFRLDSDGAVSGFLGSCSSEGNGPCHLAVHADGGHLFVANYNDGTVAVVTLAEDGSPTEVTQLIQHEGSGPNPSRQEGPHAHQVLPDPAVPNRVFAVDLGTDSVHAYAFDPAAGELTREHESQMPAGSGPRHLALHPEADVVYVVGELDSTLTACAYDRDTGVLEPVSTVSLLPEGASPEGNTAAEVVVTSDGRFVYGSVRGEDIIAAYSVDGSDATALQLVDRYPCGGSGPRHISLDPGERWLYVANQHSGTVAVFEIDPDSGALTQAGEPLDFPQAVCVLPVPPA